MRFFYVGLAMRSQVHDYAEVHAALFGMRAHRVSPRIWLCVVQRAWADQALEAVGRALASGDEMLVAEVPESHRAPRVIQAAA